MGSYRVGSIECRNQAVSSAPGIDLSEKTTTMLFRVEYRMRWDELDMYQRLSIFPNLRIGRGTRANGETADAPIPQSTAAMEIEARRVNDKSSTAAWDSGVFPLFR